MDIPRIISIWAALGPEHASRAVWIEVLRRVAIAGGALVVAVGVRTLIGQEPGITPFATLYPAIGIVALLAGVWAGITTLVIGWLAAWLLFFDAPGGALTQAQILSTVLFAISGGVLIAVSAWLRDTIGRLEQSAVRYRALIDASTSLVATTDAEGRWREREPAWETLTGKRWPEYRGDGWLASVHEDDRSAVRTALGAAKGEGLRLVQARVWNQRENEWRWFSVGIVALRTARGSADDRIVTFADIHERKLARERQELLLGDLRHRLKNLVAVIRALLTSSLPKDDKVAAQVAEKFMARLQALQSAGDLVMAANWRDVDIRDIVNNVLEPFQDAQKRFEIEGPSLLLHEQTAGGIALASHELATNAIKYGALSSPDGKVSVRWWVEPVGEDERVIWTWAEDGGPSVREPEREGFGLRVIRSAVVRERENSVDLKFEPPGVQCRIEFVRPRVTVN